MARAAAHLAAGRYAEAAGAFRAVLGIDGSAIPARLGLAEALVARGQRAAAVTGLVEAAEACSERDQHAHAIILYAKALALDPSREELHLDVAMVEHAMGRRDAATARVEGLAERYMATGRTEQAAEILRFLASWGDDADEVDDALLEEVEPEESVSTVIARNPLPHARPSKAAAPASTETVVCATVLVRPDGSLWLGPSAGAPAIDEADPDMVTRVAGPPKRSAQDTLPTRPRTLEPTARAASSRRPPLPPGPARVPPARPPIQPANVRPAATAARRPATPPPAPAKASASVPAPAKASASVPAPAEASASVPATAPSSSVLVERLRRRAGLGPEVVAVPQGNKPGTEPIVIRRPNLGRSERDDEVTNRFRAPGPSRLAMH